jgi:drug/metabolite transporter (DMT)-like permease
MGDNVTALALVLVLISAVMHAGWNFLAKRSTDNIAFLCGMAGVATALVIVPGIVWGAIEGFEWKLLGWGAGTAVIHSVYIVALARSYRLGDLSSVYPISRGMGPALVPLLAVPILGETVSAPAAAGIALVVVGIYAMHIDSRFWRDLSHPARTLATPATRTALFTGLVIACYTLWDKAALDDDIPPLTLMTFSMAANFLVLIPLAGRRLAAEWQADWPLIVGAGVLTSVSYALVLIALTTSRVSYIAPSREIGIVVGTALGVLLLGEGYGFTRIWGSALIVAGVALLALAP